MPTDCPSCCGPGCLLGVLGSRIHLRCRDCGVDFSRAVPDREEMEEVLSALSCADDLSDCSPCEGDV